MYLNLKVMKKFLLTIAIFTIVPAAFSQKINGQWRGYFNERDNNISLLRGNTEYVLELEINGETVSGTSYTYFDNRRYYVICNLNGTYDKKSKKILVNETERVKGLTPTDWSDCLQTHILFYEKQDGKEILNGEWKTSPYNSKKNGGCGYGATTLSRRILTNSFTFNKETRTPKPLTKSTPTPSFKDKNKITPPPVVKTQSKAPVTAPAVKTQPKDSPAKKDIVKAEPQVNTPKPTEEKIKNAARPFEKRTAAVVKTIEIEQETFNVDLYDNGDIDGDTISLFYNGKLLLSQKKLTDKPLSLKLSAESNKDVNELIMYAENLGSIPPNTALMVVTDGPNRYEVRISSDLQKSGVIRFVHKPKLAQ